MLKLKVHPLKREAHRHKFKQTNPKRYQNDLGTQDVFLDNFALFLHEQVQAAEWDEYTAALDLLMLYWQLLHYKVLQRTPY